MRARRATPRRSRLRGRFGHAVPGNDRGSCARKYLLELLAQATIYTGTARRAGPQGGTTAMTTQTRQALPTGTWNLDKVHSTVAFAVDYMSGTFQGSFSDFDAQVVDSTLRGSAEVASIQAKDPNLEAHLQGP